jgi:hypothetical protein
MLMGLVLRYQYALSAKDVVEIDEHAGPRSSNALCQWSPIGFKRTVNDADE